MAQTVITIVIFIAMIVSYSLNRIPMALTSMIGMLLLVITGCVSSSSVLSTIGSGTVLTMISMFIIAAGLQRTQMVDKLSGLVYRVSKGSFTKVLAGYVLVTFILGQFLPSTTAIVALVCPLVVSMCREMKINPSKMLFSVAIVGVAASWTFTPIDPYAANYIESNGMLAEYGITGVEFTIFDEMIDKIPCTIVVILWAIFFAPKFAPDIPDPMLGSFTGPAKKEKAPLGPVREVIGYGVFAAVIICLMFRSFGLPSWVIPACGAHRRAERRADRAGGDQQHGAGYHHDLCRRGGAGQRLCRHGRRGDHRRRGIRRARPDGEQLSDRRGVLRGGLYHDVAAV